MEGVYWLKAALEHVTLGYGWRFMMRICTVYAICLVCGYCSCFRYIRYAYLNAFSILQKLEGHGH
jgi:hypothetical protein